MKQVVVVKSEVLNPEEWTEYGREPFDVLLSGLSLPVMMRLNSRPHITVICPGRFRVSVST